MVPARPSAGESNVLTAIIDASLRRTPGLYRLQVVLRTGWNETLGAVGECVLLDHTVFVEQPARPNDAWIVGGSLSACAALVGAIVLWARRKSAELRNVLLMVLTEASKSVLSITFKLGNLATDLLATYRVVFEGIAKSTHYRMPYAIFGSLSIVVGVVSIAHLGRIAFELWSQIKTHAEVQQEPIAPSEPSPPVTLTPSRKPGTTPPRKPGTTPPRDLDADIRRATAQKLEWEVEKVARDQRGLAVGVLCLLLQDLPMVRIHRHAPCRDSESAEATVGTVRLGRW
jgi:hypothetical protein